MKLAKIFMAVAVAIIAVLLISCSGNISKSKQEISINIVRDPVNLVWNAAESASQFQIYHWTMEGLTRSNGKGKAVPGIASKWDVSPDGKVWTFHLRDAKWSDGKDITASDFVYGAMLTLGAKGSAGHSYLMFDILGAEEYSKGGSDASKVGINALDDKTIEFRLKNPTPYFGYLVSLPAFTPVRQDVYEKLGSRYNSSPEFLVTNGPFKMTEWEKGSRITLEKSESYWNTSSIRISRVTAHMVTDTDEELSMFISGKLDQMSQIDSYGKTHIEDAKAGEIDMVPDGSVWFLNYNMSDNVLRNKNIRKALTYAIDRETLIKSTVNLPWKPATSIVQPDIIPDAYWSGTFRDKAPSYFKDNDADMARKHLETGLRELGISKLRPVSILITDTETYRKYAGGLKDMWKSTLGVDVTIEAVPSNERIRRQSKREYQISLAGWGADYPDPLNVLGLYVTGGGSNDPGYGNPQYDKLIASSKSEIDQLKRYELLHKAEAVLMDDMPVGPLYYRYRHCPTKEHVKGLGRSIFGPDIDFMNAYIDKK